MFGKYVVPLLEFRAKNCEQIVKTCPLNSVKNLCILFDCVGTVENGVSITLMISMKSKFHPDSLILFLMISHY